MKMFRNAWDHGSGGGAYLGSEMHDSVDVFALEEVSNKVEGLDAAAHKLVVGEVRDLLEVVEGCAVVQLVQYHHLYTRRKFGSKNTECKKHLEVLSAEIKHPRSKWDCFHWKSLCDECQNFPANVYETGAL